MSYVIYDFECENCGRVWEDMVDRTAVESPCPGCTTVSTNKLVACPAIASFSMLPLEDRSKLMKRRSEEHTKKEMRKEAERWGDLGKERAREGVIRNNK